VWSPRNGSLTVKTPGLVAVVAGLLVVTALAAACSSSSGGASSSSPTTSLLVTYGPQPTSSAKMICAAEARAEIRSALNATPTTVTPPTWRDHTYQCTYVYRNGSFTMSVKELPSIAATVDYFDTLKAQHRPEQDLALGQDGFVATDSTAVVRKDNKVLIVDVSKLPAAFGQPPQTQSTISESLAAVILGCWTGAS
jgi:hypothetical protein